MKSNFKYLTKQLDKIQYPLNHDFSRYLRDLNFLFIETEKKIYLREPLAASYTLRMIWDLSKKFTIDMLKVSTEPDFIKWNQNIKNFRTSNKNKNYEPPIGYITLWKQYPNPEGFKIENVANYGHNYAATVFDELNKWMHYEYDKNFKDSNDANNINDKSTLYTHRNLVRFHKPSLRQLSNYLETLWYSIFTVMMKSGLFTNVEKYDYNFDRTIYNDPEPAMMKLLQHKHIDDLVTGRRKCPICEKGNFNMPNFDELREAGVTLPYGAYLECDQEDCRAKVDTSLKVKKDLKQDENVESVCRSCKSEGSLQKRYSFLKEEDAIYIACNKCSWNNKNERNFNTNIIDDDIAKIVEEHQHDWDEDQYDWDDYES